MFIKQGSVDFPESGEVPVIALEFVEFFKFLRLNGALRLLSLLAESLH